MFVEKAYMNFELSPELIALMKRIYWFYSDVPSFYKIRESSLVRKIKNKKTDAASCTSCDKRLAAVANDIPVRCYIDGF